MSDLGNHLTPINDVDHDDTNAAKDFYVNGPFGVAVTGTINEFHIYMRSGTNPNTYDYRIRPLVFGADGADPGAIIATLPEIQVFDYTPSWRSVTGLSVAFTGPIYIGWCQNASDGTSPLWYYFLKTGDGEFTSGAGFYKGVATATYTATGDLVTGYPGGGGTTWPKTTDTPTSTQQLLVYVVYTPGSAGPVNTVAPAVTGTTTEGSTLSCTTGTWTG